VAHQLAPPQPALALLAAPLEPITGNGVLFPDTLFNPRPLQSVTAELSSGITQKCKG